MNKEYTKRLIQKAEETIKSLCKIYEYFRIIISMLTLYFAILYKNRLFFLLVHTDSNNVSNDISIYNL